MSGGIGAPSPVFTALEYRAVGERAAMAAAQPALRHLLPDRPNERQEDRRNDRRDDRHEGHRAGDRHPVLFLPGFTAGDRSTRPLRRLFANLGYDVHGWNLGVNLGPTERVLGGMFRTLERIARGPDPAGPDLDGPDADEPERGVTPVSVVGWSLGGIYARELARARPDLVRQVITLGSPIQMIESDRSAAQAMWDNLRRYHVDGLERHIRDVDRPPLEVPATSIYSRTDGIVHWSSCLIERTSISENIRVYGSHCGLGVNSAVAAVIADRLAQPAHAWAPFRPPWYLRGAFPPSADFDRVRSRIG